MENNNLGSQGKYNQTENESIRKERILHEKRVDYPRLGHRDPHEEYAGEIAPTRSYNDDNKKTDENSNSNSEVQMMDAGTGQMAGYVGLAFGVVSLFMWSIILGPIAAVIGYYAFSQGNKTTGGWAIALGILATLSYFVLIPFVS